MLVIESLEYNDFSQYSSEMVQNPPIVLYRRAFNLLHIRHTRYKFFQVNKGLSK